MLGRLPPAVAEADFLSSDTPERAEVSSIEVKLDYKPKRLDLNALRKGSMGELINLFHFEESRLVLRHASVRGVSLDCHWSTCYRTPLIHEREKQVVGWGAIYDALTQIWSPDIRANQMSDLIGGAAPIRSLIQVGSGVADLILLPIEQWQKDGRVVKGLQRGGTSFAKTTSLEVLKLGSKLAKGTQVILDKAERALRNDSSSSSSTDSSGSRQARVMGDTGPPGGVVVRQQHSRYADQPRDARQGLSQAYQALAGDLGSAVQTILAIPMEVHEDTSNHVSLLHHLRHLHQSLSLSSWLIFLFFFPSKRPRGKQ